MTDLRAALIEAGADAVNDLPFDTLELRNWGEESVADPYRIVSEAVIDRVLDTLADRADEWWHLLFEPEYRKARVTDNLIAVLREGDE